jgi:hypothetical protein
MIKNLLNATKIDPYSPDGALNLKILMSLHLQSNVKMQCIPPFGKGRLGGIFIMKKLFAKISPIPSLPKRGICMTSYLPFKLRACYATLR